MKIELNLTEEERDQLYWELRTLADGYAADEYKASAAITAVLLIAKALGLDTKEKNRW